MKRSLAQVLSLAFVAVSVAATIVPLLWTNSTQSRLLILGIGAVVLAGGLVAYFKSRGHHNAMAALKGIPEDRKLEVTRIENKAQLKELWELDQRSYGDENIDFKTLQAWWNACRNGIYILNQGSRIIGAMGILPLKEARFDELFEGKSHESEIEPEDIAPVAPGMTHASWYVSGIVLEGFVRKTHAISQLLSETLHLWLSEHPFPGHLRLVAIAYSRQGEAMLRRFHFHNYKKAEETITRHPVYLFETRDPARFDSILQRITEARSTRRRAFR